MSLPSSKKVSKFHLKCAVCDKSCASEYDAEIKAYPVYHTKKDYPAYDCEEKFYRILMGIYKFLLGHELSVPVNIILSEVSALNDIDQKKEMLTWFLARGYLQVDELHRIDIPRIILHEFEELFTEDALSNLDKRVEASEWIQKKLRLMREELHPVTPDRMPFKQNELKLGKSTLFDNIDISKVELRRDKRKDSGDTAARTSSFRSSIDRRRG